MGIIEGRTIACTLRFARGGQNEGEAQRYTVHLNEGFFSSLAKAHTAWWAP
jgi:hypothetical protein